MNDQTDSGISLEGVTRRYPGGTVAVDGLDLAVPRGTLLCLLGASGCGKTTTLRMIAGLDQATTGRIALGGRPVDHRDGGVFVPPERRDLGLVFQHYALWPHMRVADTVAFGLRRRKLSKEEVTRRVGAVLNRLGLGDLGDRYPFQLSGGQQQRVALARTLVTQPSLLLLDEPLSNLDAQLRADMRATIRTLHDELGSTTVFVTHDQQEAMTLADRIAVMHGGRLEQLGSPMEVYARPASLHVARFVGSPAIAVVPTAHPAVATAIARIAERTPASARAATHAAVRPERLVVRAARDGDTEWTLRTVQPTGTAWICEMTRGDERLTAVLAEPPGLPGDAVTATAEPEAVHLFDSAGLRIPHLHEVATGDVRSTSR